MRADFSVVATIPAPHVRRALREHLQQHQIAGEEEGDAVFVLTAELTRARAVLQSMAAPSPAPARPWAWRVSGVLVVVTLLVAWQWWEESEVVRLAFAESPYETPEYEAHDGCVHFVVKDSGELGVRSCGDKLFALDAKGKALQDTQDIRPDGRPEFLTRYDKKGDKVEELYDDDNDGRFDEATLWGRDRHIAGFAKDLDKDGRFDEWTSVGKFHEIFRDEDGDGFIDSIEMVDGVKITREKKWQKE